MRACVLFIVLAFKDSDHLFLGCAVKPKFGLHQ